MTIGRGLDFSCEVDRYLVDPHIEVIEPLAGWRPLLRLVIRHIKREIAGDVGVAVVTEVIIDNHFALADGEYFFLYRNVVFVSHHDSTHGDGGGPNLGEGGAAGEGGDKNQNGKRSHNQLNEFSHELTVIDELSTGVGQDLGVGLAQSRSRLSLCISMLQRCHCPFGSVLPRR